MSGLINTTNNTCVLLQSVNITAKLVDNTADVEIVQVYENDDENPIEATYKVQSVCTVSSLYSRI